MMNLVSNVGNRCASRKRRLTDLLLFWTSIVPNTCQKDYAFSSIITASASISVEHFRSHRRRRHREGQSPAKLAFVLGHERKTAGNPCCLGRCPQTTSPVDHCFSWDRCMLSTSLGAGRERRISSISQLEKQEKNQEQEYAQEQEQRKLVEKEESARRKRLDQMEQRLHKAVRREDRITVLQEKIAREQQYATVTIVTDAEKAELKGLLSAQDNYEETYDPKSFSEEHRRFKAHHNDVFARLVRWCEEREEVKLNIAGTSTSSPSVPINTNTKRPKVFFLDGPDGETANFLINEWHFAPNQCHVANRHKTSCEALRQSGGGLLPDENVVHATASEALTKGTATALDDDAMKQQGALSQVEFTGFYFDGCNGYAPHIINMISSALLVLEGDSNKIKRYETKDSIVVGYSLLGGTKNLVEKELEVSRALTTIARSRGMKIVHALDDPSLFGLPQDVPKIIHGSNGGGATFTTWIILQSE